MRPRELLQLMEATKLGSDVAEHENDLSHLFVTDNEAYLSLIGDNADVIFGVKGSGKSAMYRMITESRVHDDLKVIRASNPTAAPEFRSLFSGDDSEDRLRSIWAVYITSTIGNFIIDNLQPNRATKADFSELREILELMGLRTQSPEKESLLSRIRRAKSIEGRATGGAAGLELGVALRFDLPDAPAGPTSSIILDYPDFFSLLQKCCDILRASAVRVWLAFDRLDECFVHGSEIERRALRALLRTHLDASEALSHRPSLRLKIFLRSDMLTRMTEDGAFTNATHLRRAEIIWSFNSMRDLIARRLIRNQAFTEQFLAGHPVAEWADEAWDALLPKAARKRGANGRTAQTKAQILSRETADGSRALNPRNLITLVTMSLDRARQNHRRALQLGREDRDVRPLIKEGELTSAYGELSRRRLQDTVLNEFPAVQPHVDRLRGGSAQYDSSAELLSKLGVNSPDEGDAAISQLQLSGLIGITDGKIVIPKLYRPALRAKMPAQSS